MDFEKIRARIAAEEFVTLRVAKKFKNQKELDQYMRKHPGAKKYYHKVMKPAERELQKEGQREKEQRERDIETGTVDERKNHGKGGPGSMRWRPDQIKNPQEGWLAKIEALMNKLKEFENGADKERAGALLKRLEAIKNSLSGKQASIPYVASRLLMASVATSGVFRRFAQLTDEQKQEVVKKVMEKMQEKSDGKDEGESPDLDAVEKKVNELEQGVAADSVPKDEEEKPGEESGDADGADEGDGESAEEEPASDEDEGDDSESPDADIIDEALGKSSGKETDGDSDGEDAEDDSEVDAEEDDEEGDVDEDSGDVPEPASVDEGDEGEVPEPDAEDEDGGGDEGGDEIPEPATVEEDSEDETDSGDLTEGDPEPAVPEGGDEKQNADLLGVVNDLAAEIKQVKSDGRVDPSEILGLLGNMMQMVTLLVHAKPPPKQRNRKASIDEVARIEKMINRVANHGLKVTGARGMQVRRKDKDLMSDTGGISKGREREPEAKPPRDDMKKPHRTKDTPARDRDPDTHNDPDKRKD
jgi:hypothetical protein